MEYLILFLKGMVVGVSNIIPGVSGGTIMITLGLYEKIIDIISHFFHNFKKNILFLLPLGIGMVVSILLLSKVISTCLDKYPFPTTFFFVGLILGGLPLLWGKAKYSKGKLSNWFIFLITFLIVLLFAFLNSGNNTVSLENINILSMISLFIVGVIASITMVVPGISGSFVMMLIGYYEPIVNLLKDLTNFRLLKHNLLVLVPLGIGIIIGIIGISKLINYLLKKYPVKTYYGVLGFVMASLIAIIRPLLSTSPSFLELIVSIVLVLVGGIIAYKLGEK